MKETHDHKPVQHRDGKPPWCETCGLTEDFRIPVSRFEKQKSNDEPVALPNGQVVGKILNFESNDQGVYAHISVNEETAELLRAGSISDFSVRAELDEEASDGHHTFDELYEYRMLYHAHAAREWHRHGTYSVVKSMRHSDGQLCFGGGWFIVVAYLPWGQVSNHYKMEHWDLFEVPGVYKPAPYDGHTPRDAADRLWASLVPDRDVHVTHIVNSLTENLAICNGQPYSGSQGAKVTKLCPACYDRAMRGSGE